MRRGFTPLDERLVIIALLAIVAGFVTPIARQAYLHAVKNAVKRGVALGGWDYVWIARDTVVMSLIIVAVIMLVIGAINLLICGVSWLQSRFHKGKPQ